MALWKYLSFNVFAFSRYMTAVPGAADSSGGPREVKVEMLSKQFRTPIDMKTAQ